jgi:hypothetical protein
MGVNAHIAINQMWKEPAVLWFIIAAKKGQKKTAALRLLKKPLQEIEERETKKWLANHGNEQNESPPQLSIDNFSFEELHNVMRRNGSQILGLFDEMSTMYGQLDLYKQSGSVMDRKTLNGGSSWSTNYRNYTASMSKTTFNVADFIQPAFIEKMLVPKDADRFNDRQIFAFPPQRDVLLNDLKLLIPPNVPSVKEIYTLIRVVHEVPREYTMDGDALTVLRESFCPNHGLFDRAEADHDGCFGDRAIDTTATGQMQHSAEGDRLAYFVELLYVR